MIVRLHMENRSAARSVSRWLEFLLLCGGLAALDVWVWVQVDMNLHQAADQSTLELQMRDTRPSKPGFVARPAARELIGRIAIPRLQLSATVREGVDDSTLRIAVGHMPSSPLPGMPGNIALAAHRDTLFRKLSDIRKQDRIRLETTHGSYDYVVESLTVVRPSDVSVLRAGPDDRVLTLITCYPFNYIGSAPNRFIVKARQLTKSQAARPASPPKGSLASRPA
jgi:sortase A